MKTSPILFAGGSGVVGRAALSWFRQRHPGVPTLVGGRDLRRARAVAEQLGATGAVTVDFDRTGIGYDGEVSALVSLAPDHALNGLRFAQDQGIPYVTGSTWLSEAGAELAVFAHRPTIPVLLASHWWGGSATFLALRAADAFDTVRSVRIGAVVDSEDETGPAAIADMQRSDGSAAILAIKGGQRVWLSGTTARSEFRAADDRLLNADAYAPLDIASLLASTKATDIRFDLATDVSSSRRRGGPIAAELVVEVEGDSGGETKLARSTLEFPGGQASITGLSVAISLTPLLGIGEHAPSRPGLYLPELLSDYEHFIAQLSGAGASISDS